ncbi:ABL039Cp [Eremothecium gossypii ATCC 10895]|uniref:ABL039Cp n=1 Tax=Eremothecium gossypii (strain ATCC 10895 / CBS 109.51 / FGSC 9923 / NRRL Y-1056) TaxID=284811 RepID=Q75DQ6_EREGS|nr:ABL039Cp [Eremothecium gossypii ATCC 10895]AAS50732.2 ABL039Cp [Eremothecium gossypii ATCC 10895]AEY95021.1 FABL039Cp [Eremothecium gossypii FDAG1]
MRLCLIDNNQTVCEVWRRWLDGVGDVKVWRGGLEAVAAWDCGVTRGVVSPGNSLGYLRGGFDLGLRELLGGAMFEDWVRGQLGRSYRPLGACAVLHVPERFSAGGVRYLLHVPTMVAPTAPVFDAARPVATGVQPVFDAVWGVLQALPAEVEELLLPGIGTGYAGIPASIAAVSMAFAIRLHLVREQLSAELVAVMIMCFLGCQYEPFMPEHCRREYVSLGLPWERLLSFDVLQDSLDEILPRALRRPAVGNT